MAYYIEIRPRGEKPVTVDEFKQRFFDLGLLPHPALACETEQQWVKDQCKDDIATSVGIITVQESDRAPCGVTSFLRVSWGYAAENVAEVVVLILQLASAISADVVGPQDEIITHENAIALAHDFAKGKRVVGGLLGTCKVP